MEYHGISKSSRVARDGALEGFRGEESRECVSLQGNAVKESLGTGAGVQRYPTA
jgi:hypothetical protein